MRNRNIILGTTKDGRLIRIKKNLGKEGDYMILPSKPITYAILVHQMLLQMMKEGKTIIVDPKNGFLRKKEELKK